MQLIIFSAVLGFASAALLPSNSYLPQKSGGLQQNSFSQSQSSGFIALSGPNDNGNRRPQQEAEKNAATLKETREVNENGFQYSYETSNGIRAEESGNAERTQGGFAYKGDDGNTYSITFTSGVDGFRPQGAHLPVAPPTPAEILIALEQNAKDEASGIFDDGQYRADNSGQYKPEAGGSGSSSKNSFSSSKFTSTSQQSNFGAFNRQPNFNANSGYQY